MFEGGGGGVAFVLWEGNGSSLRRRKFRSYGNNNFLIWQELSSKFDAAGGRHFLAMKTSLRLSELSSELFHNVTFPAFLPF